MSGAVARALARATTEFIAAGEGAAEHFEVVVVVGTGDCEVAFVPQPDPGPPVRGGQAQAGRERHFGVSIGDGELLRSSFAR